MQHGMEHRIGNFLKGLAWLVSALGYYLVFGLPLYKPSVLGYFQMWTWAFVIVGPILGIFMMVKSCFPIKYEMRECITCGTPTEQFEKKREIKKSQSKYVCEKCGKENIIPLCKTCKKPMDKVNGKGDEWYCVKDQVQSPAKENLKVKTSKQVTEKTTPTTLEPVIKVRRKTSSLVLLAIICVIPLFGLGYFLITPLIPIDQTIIGYTTASLIRTSTPYIATTIFGTTSGPCGSGYYYYYATTCVTRVGLYVQVTPVLVSDLFTTSYSYTSTTRVCTISPYASSQGGSIALILGAVVLAGIFLFYFGRTRQTNPEIASASQPLSKHKVEPKKEAAKSMTKFCRECGTKIPRDSLFCEKCGATLK